MVFNRGFSRWDSKDFLLICQVLLICLFGVLTLISSRKEVTGVRAEERVSGRSTFFQRNTQLEAPFLFAVLNFIQRERITPAQAQYFND